jgi:cell division septum initiation protein DivIVA
MSLTDAPTFGAWPGRSRLTPEGARRQEFSRAPLGRRGYLESDVERFRARVADELTRHDAEKAELRAEIDRLRNYFREQNIEPRRPREPDAPDLSVFADPEEHRWFQRGNGTVEDARELRRRRRDEPAGDPPDAWAAAVAADPWGTGPIQQPVLPPPGQDPSLNPPSVQAVNVLSQAQQAADQHIAQAEDSARQLIRTARAQYERILMEAHQKAEEAAQQAARAYDDAAAMEAQVGAGSGSEEELQRLQERMAYLKTFAEISRVQMRSVLEALGAELDRLTDGLDPAPDPPATPAGGTATQVQGSGPPATDPVTQPTRTLDLRALESRRQ